jgi:DNA topoisomerase VI subunit A
MHNVRMPIDAEDNGLIVGPIPIGENQERTIEMIAATPNGLRTFDSVFATLISMLRVRFTAISEDTDGVFQLFQGSHTILADH